MILSPFCPSGWFHAGLVAFLLQRKGKMEKRLRGLIRVAAEFDKRQQHSCSNGDVAEADDDDASIEPGPTTLDSSRWMTDSKMCANYKVHHKILLSKLICICFEEAFVILVKMAS